MIDDVRRIAATVVIAQLPPPVVHRMRGLVHRLIQLDRRNLRKERAPMHTANEIADWFIAWAEDEHEATLSNLKLQKLLYYAQGHHLGQTGRPLFSEQIQAWSHGPVVPQIYHRFKKYGRSEINPDVEISDDFNWDDYSDVSRELIRTWNTYGHLSAWSLRDRTHREEPWKKAFNGERNTIIDPDSMKAFFSAAA